MIEAEVDLVFQTPPNDIWKKAMEQKGGFWAIVAPTDIKPSLT